MYHKEALKNRNLANYIECEKKNIAVKALVFNVSL